MIMTPYEKEQLLKLVAKLPTTTECPDCHHFDGGYCNAAQSKIPDDVMKVGCELWEFDPTRPPF